MDKRKPEGLELPRLEQTPHPSPTATPSPKGESLRGLELPRLAAEKAPEGESYLMEAANGMLVRVPAEKLEQWQAAQRSGELSPGLRKYKQQIKDRLMQELYGRKK